MIPESKYIRVEPDLDYTNPDGTVVFYNLIVAGLNPDYPEMVVIEKSEKMPEADLTFVEHSAIVGFAKRKGIDVIQQDVYSERDHDRYDHVRLELRGRKNDAERTPIYGHRRDHGTNFDKTEIYDDLKKIAERCEHIEKQNQQMQDSELSVGDASFQDELKRLREAAEKELQQELEQRKKR